MTGNVSLSVFGKFEVCIGESPIRSIAAPKTQALLIYLAMERDRPWTRDRLAALFWPDAADIAARNNLRQSLFLLRRALGPAADELLAVSPRTVQWNPAAGARVDAAEFDRLLQAAGGREDDASLQLVEQAVALYRAPLLDGMPNCGSDLFDEWLSMQRERLAQRASAALAKLSDAYLARREFRQAERFARRLLELDPLCEPAHRSVMRSLAGLGDPAAALRQFKQCVALLQAGLDVGPMPETTALANEIRASVPGPNAVDLAGPAEAVRAPGEQDEEMRRRSPSTRQAFSLTETHPTPLMTFIGRRKELARVVALLLDPACRLLTLCGPGGVGKTRLALQAAAQVETAFGDGALFVSMVGVRYPEEVVPTIARAVAASPLMNGAPAELVAAFLRPRHLLLVIDKFEQVVEGAPQLVALLQAAPQIKILVTSREVLRLYGERTFRVPPLTLARRDVDAPETIAASDAVQLFVSHARTAVPEFEAKAENLEAIAELCARLDGLPLAIELAAARVRMLSPQKMLDQLRRGKSATRLLDRGASDVPPRQRTLFAAIDWSYQLLTDEERTVFRRLAVFAGGASLDEIHAVCIDDGELLPSGLASDGTSMDRLMGLVESLMDKSLILCEESGGMDAELRVELLVTMREYGYQQLEEEGEAASIQRRHALAYLHFAAANHPYPVAQSALPIEAQLRRVRLLHREFDNYQAALRWSFGDPNHAPHQQAHDPELGMKLVEAMQDFWFMANNDEGLLWTVRAVAALADPQVHVTDDIRARFFYFAGRASFAVNNREGFHPAWWLQQAMGYYQAIGEKQAYGLALVWLIQHCYVCGRRDEIPPLAAQLIALVDRHPFAAAFILLGRLAFVGDQLAQAHHWLALAERYSAAGSDAFNMIYTAGFQGFLALKEGTGPVVERQQMEALKTARVMQRKDFCVFFLNTLCEIGADRGDVEPILAMVGEALPLARDLNESYLVATNLLHGALALHRQAARFVHSHEAERRVDQLIAAAVAITQRSDPENHQAGVAYRRTLDRLCGVMGDDRLTAAVAQTPVMAMDEAIRFFLQRP